jgi:hypothetical protein
MTGTMALGFNAMNSGVCVDLNPEPQSSRSKGIPISAQAQSTFRTLIDDALPSTRNIPCPYSLWLIVWTLSLGRAGCPATAYG